MVVGYETIKTGTCIRAILDDAYDARMSTDVEGLSVVPVLIVGEVAYA